MARIRTVKPEFFRHEGLQDLEAANPGKYPMLVFEGLWGHCDKAGRFRWKPRTLKLDILPFLPFDMGETLALLEQAGFLIQYESNGELYGQIPSFEDHQRIGGKEAQEPALYPDPESPESTVKQRGSTGEATVKQLGLQEGKGKEGNRKGRERNGEAAVPFPDWIDPERWQAWMKIRPAKARTPDAQKAAIEKLDGFRLAGHDPNAILAESLANGWQGIFAPKVNGSGGMSLGDRNRAAADEAVRRMELEQRPHAGK